MKTQLILQDIILNHSRRERIDVDVVMVNGEILTGIVRGFDNVTVILDRNKEQLMLYKTNISYIISKTLILNGETKQ